jgi:hypothetical protein
VLPIDWQDGEESLVLGGSSGFGIAGASVIPGWGFDGIPGGKFGCFGCKQGRRRDWSVGPFIFRSGFVVGNGNVGGRGEGGLSWHIGDTGWAFKEAGDQVALTFAKVVEQELGAVAVWVSLGTELRAQVSVGSCRGSRPIFSLEQIIPGCQVLINGRRSGYRHVSECRL